MSDKRGSAAMSGVDTSGEREAKAARKDSGSGGAADELKIDEQAQKKQQPPVQQQQQEKLEKSSTATVAGSEASSGGGGGGDVEMREASKLEEVARVSGQPVAQTATSLGDLRRVWEKHNEYLQSQSILNSLPQLFPNYSVDDAQKMLLWMAQLPVAMHRPRPVLTEGWKAAGEILTIQWDEKLPSIFAKLIDNNISCLPVLDQHRRYLGLLDNQSVVIHALKAFGIMDPAERAKSLHTIAMESEGLAEAEGAGSSSTAGGAAGSSSGGEAKGASVGGAAAEGGAPILVKPSGVPVFIAGGEQAFAGRPIWKGDTGASASDWAERWERRSFKDSRAIDLLSEMVPTLGSSTSSAQVVVGELALPAPSAEVVAPPMQQGSSTLFAVELMARSGLQRVPILNSERYLTGLITQSMLISLLGQNRQIVPAMGDTPVANIVQFLAPHRLVVVEESVIAAHAFATFVKERVSGGAIVNSAGTLVDVLSSRDLRGIGRSGQSFERLWQIVREFKQTVRRAHPDKTPAEVNWVSAKDKLVDVLAKMQDGNLHRVFVCELVDDLPKPVAVITQRDMLRILLIHVGQTLQGEVRIAMA